jgi:hypothetical protein
MDLDALLTEKTKDAIQVITTTLDLPHLSKFPTVKADPQQSGYYPFQNNILLAKDDPIDIFEEAGHYVHHAHNPSARIKGYNTIFSTYNTFFNGVLTEAIGYFCSKLSGSERTTMSRAAWKKMYVEKETEYAELLKLYEEVHATIQGNPRQEAFEKEYAENVTAGKRLKAERAFAEMGEKIFAHLETKGTDAPFFIMHDLHDQQTEIMDFPIDVQNDMWDDYHHILGYELGEELFNAWKQGKHIIRHIHTMIYAKVDQSPETFFRTYKELKKLGWYNEPTSSLPSSPQEAHVV